MLTTEQQATLAADIAADPVLMALPHNSDGAFAIASAYQELAAPSFIVWTNISNPGRDYAERLRLGTGG